MFEVLATGGLVNLFYLVAILLITRLVIRFIARRTGTDFNNVVGKINEDPRSAAIFWGATGLGVCMVAAGFTG